MKRMAEMLSVWFFLFPLKLVLVRRLTEET